MDRVDLGMLAVLERDGRASFATQRSATTICLKTIKQSASLVDAARAVASR